MANEILKNDLKLYAEELEGRILPFWLKNAIDFEEGGYFTCFSNDDSTLLSTDKYTWSQGRLVWVFSKLSTSYPNKEYLSYARLGVDFLMQHALLENGNASFLLTKSGAPKEIAKGLGYDSSIYADCFMVLGLASFAAATKEKKTLNFTMDLFNSILTRLKGEYRSEPYPIPEGYEAHGINMILLNTAQEVVLALEACQDPRALEVDSLCNDLVQKILTTFLKEDGLLHEFVNESGKQNLLTNYINPGHSLEDLWFLVHQALRNGNKEIIKTCVEITKKTYQAGWDHEYGGLQLFADPSGGKPQGEAGELICHPMIKKITLDWSDKLWWPHVEALYVSLLTYQLTNDRELFELYEKTRDYTFEVFPNPNREIGEWIQIRDRKGKPANKVVALPVKDPFHIIRTLLYLIDLLEKFEGGILK